MDTKNKNSSDDEILPEARIFELRAQNIFKRKHQAMQEVWNKVQDDDLEDYKKDDDEEEMVKPQGRKSKQRKLKSKAGSQKKSRRKAKPTEDNDDNPEKSTEKDKVDDKSESFNADDLIASMNLRIESKRKIQEVKLSTSRLKRQIDMQNEEIISACDAISTEVEYQPPENFDSDQSIILKIRLLSDITKLTVKLTEKFSSIYDKVADMHNLKASEILLCIRDQTIKPTNMPLLLNLKNFDIIDCLPYKPFDKLENDASEFFLKMQSNDTRKKIDVYGSRCEKFQIFMKRYSEIRNIPMKKLCFEFDGEKIEESKTPKDLEMESESCIDVKVMVEAP